MKYRFGDHELCTHSFSLRRNGEQCAIEPQVLELLRVLVERAGALVTHSELIETVWGGRIVSDSAISARISAARAAIGDDGTRQEWIKTVPRRGFRFVGQVKKDEAGGRVDAMMAERRQEVSFCKSRDGTKIAYARSGGGPVLVRAGHWLTHVEHDWHSPVWRPILNEMGQRFTLLRYDQRGNGLSDREVEDLSLDAFVADLEAVIDAAPPERFTLYGTSQGAPVAIAYAVRHPERVSRLILHGGYAVGSRRRENPREREMAEALHTLIRPGWGRPGMAFVQAYASLFLPDSETAHVNSLAELQRVTATPEMAARLHQAVGEFDVSHLLEQVSVPTLVIHARDDAVLPLDQGRQLAAGIPGAEFLELDSVNHVVLPHEAAWHVLLSAIERFATREE